MIEENGSISSPSVAIIKNSLFYNEFLPEDTINNNDPYSSILYRECENPYIGCEFPETLDRFVKADVQKYFGLNIKDFLELNPYEAEVILEKSLSYKKEYDKAIQTVNDETKNIIGG